MSEHKATLGDEGIVKFHCDDGCTAMLNVNCALEAGEFYGIKLTQ